MTTTEQEKIDSRLRCVLLELSIIRQTFRAHQFHACADGITESAEKIEEVITTARKSAHILLDK